MPCERNKNNQNKNKRYSFNRRMKYAIRQEQWRRNKDQMQSNEPNQSNQSTQPNKEEPSSTSRSKRCMFCASYSGRIVRRCEKCKKEAYKKNMGMYSKSSVDFTMIALSFY
ncbi:hypothetical protein RIR_jg42517.t1 [Rhizophagus irregularis DAOM 181602=DAOM 197198]|nr:hypothetical protein RIR_jg42517.t1 [Rhizophagus irregularis DAOM 181602=DAOM 197198]